MGSPTVICRTAGLRCPVGELSVGCVRRYAFARMCCRISLRPVVPPQHAVTCACGPCGARSLGRGTRACDPYCPIGAPMSPVLIERPALRPQLTRGPVCFRVDCCWTWHAEEIKGAEPSVAAVRCPGARRCDRRGVQRIASGDARHATSRHARPDGGGAGEDELFVNASAVSPLTPLRFWFISLPYQSWMSGPTVRL